MKFTKEARIGLLVAIAIVIFFAGFYFLKGSSLFSGENNFYADYGSVQGLTQSAVVQIKGVAVGKVTAIKLDGAKVRITLSVDKDVKVPKGTVAELISLDLLGTKAVRLDLTNNTEYAKSGDQLPTAIETGIIDNISSEISPLVADVRSVVHVLDSVLTGVNSLLSGDSRDNLNKSIASLNTTMENFSQLSAKLNQQSGEITSIIKNANSITTNLKNNNEHITNVLKNAETTTDQLAKAPIEQTVKDLQKMADQLNAVMTKVNNGEGTLGMAVNDKKLYEELTGTLTNVKTLMADLQQHPSRYINVTIFGRKAKTATP